MKKTQKNILQNSQAVRLINDDTPFAIRESFNQLRTNIMYTPNDREGAPVYGITSAEPSVGKSTVSSNLAVSFAQAGKKVLLIDSDMRRPTQNRVFGYDKKHTGLSELLAGVEENDENAVVSPLPGLSLITSGIIPPNPSELMQSRKFSHFLDKWKQEYDIILIDLPPVGVVTDPLTIAKYVNGYIIITLANKSDSIAVVNAIDTVKQVGSRTVGIVLNGSSLKGDGKYSKHGYKYGYEYTHKADI